MAFVFTDQVKDYIRKIGSTTFVNVKLNFSDIDIVVENDDLISESMKISSSICNSDELKLGGCIATQFDIEIANKNDSFFVGKTFTVCLDIVDSNGSVLVSDIPLGKYIVDSAVLSGNKQYQTITAYDELYKKGNVDVSEFYASCFVDSEGNEKTVTLKTFTDSLLTHLGIAYDTSNLKNPNMVVSKSVNATSLSGVNLLRMICEATGGFGYINREGVFCVKYASSDIATTIYRDDYGFEDRNEEYKSFTREKYSTKIITNVNIALNADDDGVNASGDEDSYENTYKVISNYILSGKTESELKDICNNILMEIQRIYYTPLSVTARNIFWVDMLDRVSIDDSDYTDFVDEDDFYGYKIYYLYVFSKTTEGIQAIYDTLEAKGNEILKNEVTIYDSVETIKGKTSKIERTIDKIELRVSDLETNSTSAITQTANQIDMTVKKGDEYVTIKLGEVDDSGNLILSAEAEDILLTSDNIKIISDNFNVDTKGNLTLKGSESEIQLTNVRGSSISISSIKDNIFEAEYNDIKEINYYRGDFITGNPDISSNYVLIDGFVWRFDTTYNVPYYKLTDDHEDQNDEILTKIEHALVNEGYNDDAGNVINFCKNFFGYMDGMLVYHRGGDIVGFDLENEKMVFLSSLNFHNINGNLGVTIDYGDMFLLGYSDFRSKTENKYGNKVYNGVNLFSVDGTNNYFNYIGKMSKYHYFMATAINSSNKVTLGLYKTDYFEDNMFSNDLSDYKKVYEYSFDTVPVGTLVEQPFENVGFICNGIAEMYINMESSFAKLLYRRVKINIDSLSVVSDDEYTVDYGWDAFDYKLAQLRFSYSDSSIYSLRTSDRYTGTFAFSSQYVCYPNIKKVFYITKEGKAYYGGSIKVENEYGFSFVVDPDEYNMLSIKCKDEENDTDKNVFQVDRSGLIKSNSIEIYDTNYVLIGNENRYMKFFVNTSNPYSNFICTETMYYNVDGNVIFVYPDDCYMRVNKLKCLGDVDIEGTLTTSNCINVKNLEALKNTITAYDSIYGYSGIYNTPYSAPDFHMNLYASVVGSKYPSIKVISKNSSAERTAYLLDGVGDTQFPGTVYSNSTALTSDIRWKTHVKDLDESFVDFIMGLNPVEYYYNDSNKQRKHMGFYAQNVRDLCNELEMGDMSIYSASAKGESGDYTELWTEDTSEENLKWHLSYQEIIAPLVKTVQVQNNKINELESRLTQLEEIIANLSN